MKKLIILALIVGAGYWFYQSRHPAARMLPVTSLPAALEQARAEDKILLVVYGRENCPNCRTLRAYIDKGELKLEPGRFVYALIDCDDPNNQRQFNERFRVEGNMLPMVVVADPAGRQFDGRSGYGKADDFRKLIVGAVGQMGRNL